MLALLAISAALRESQLECLQNQLYPAIGFEAAHTNQLAASGNDDGNDGDGPIVHEIWIAALRVTPHLKDAHPLI